MPVECRVPQLGDEEDLQISDEIIESMVVLFQIEDIEAVRCQIMTDLLTMIQVYLQMKENNGPPELVCNMEKFIRECIAELIYITHNIVLCHDAVMAMI